MGFLFNFFPLIALPLLWKVSVWKGVRIDDLGVHRGFVCWKEIVP